MNNLSSEQFSKLFSPVDGEIIKLWNESTYTGFTIFKEYESPFVETNEGKNDLCCLIKIAFKNNSELSKRLLRIDLSIQSKYQQSNYGVILNGDEENPLIPKKESIEKFNKTYTPFNLSSSKKVKISYDSKDNAFYWNHEKMTLREIVDKIYDLHLKSSSIINRVLYHYPTLIFSYLFEYLIYFVLYKFLHRMIIGGRRIKDEGYFQFFLFYGNEVKLEESEKLKIDENNLEVQLPLFGGKIKMNKNGIFWGILILGLCSLLNFFVCSDVIIIEIFEYYKNNEVLAGILLIMWLFTFSYLFNEVFPKITIYIINLAIKLRKGILNRFYYKGFNYDTGNNPYKN